MSIAYLPSEGGINKVGLTKDNLWFGDSIGGKVVDKIKVKKFSSTVNYFTNVYGNLDSTSRWFFKDVTEYNFLNGITLYRCIYIGSDERYRETEILGNIAASITHNGPDAADYSVTVDIATDGKFTAFTSHSTKVLETEQDPTSVVSTRTDWASSINFSTPLNPGEYIKVWIRMKFAESASLADVTDYDYFISIKDLTIPMRRTNGRMSMSKVFSMSLTEENYIMRECLPKDFLVQNIYKVIDNGNINVFHIENDRLKLLIIKPGSNPDNSKYISLDISTFVPGITANNEFISNITECFTAVISGTAATSGTPATTGDMIDYPDISYDYTNIVGTKFLVDVFGSNKPDRNDFYLFFNTFLTDTSDEYIQRYGHRNYYWNCGVVHINLNHLNDAFFESVEAGYANVKNINLIEQYVEIIHDRFFIESVILQDDLFTGTGYIPEDCRITNNKSKLVYLWEGDVVNRKPVLQMFNIPSAFSTVANTIENNAGTEAYLTFDESHVNLINYGYFRDVHLINDGVKYVQLGPATQAAFHHGLSPVSYDMDNNELNQFSSTWSFGVSTQSITVVVPPVTGSCEITTTPAMSAVETDDVYFDENNPNHWHLTDQSQFDSFVGGTLAVNRSDYDLNLLDKNIPIFNIHCLGSQDLSAMKASYNFKARKWSLIVNTEIGDPYEVEVSEVELFATAENTITLNLFRQLDYGCSKKYIVHMDIWVNGKQLFNGISYTKYTNDTFVITHNYEGTFAGWLSYWDVKKYIETDVSKYATSMFQILSNIAWAELQSEIENVTEVESLKMFNFKRHILMRNLDWGSKESMVIPVVLQGNGYNIDTSYNSEIRRSVFDFSKIDINQKSFAFTMEGSSDLLAWKAGTYDIERDLLVVWVRIDNWSGQRIVMYYADNRMVHDLETLYPYRDDWYALWHMNNNVKIPITRYVDQKVFAGGEQFVRVSNSDGVEYLIRIDKQFVFGYTETYKSNKFDINWDDRTADKSTTDLINDFIRTHVPKFKPSFMEIRDVNSIFPYTLESGGNNFSVRETQPESSNIVVPQAPSVVCRI